MTLTITSPLGSNTESVDAPLDINESTLLALET